MSEMQSTDPLDKLRFMSMNLDELEAYLEKQNEEYGCPQHMLDETARSYKNAKGLIVVIDWKQKTIDFHYKGGNYAKDEPDYYLGFDSIDANTINHMEGKNWISRDLLTDFAHAVVTVKSGRKTKNRMEVIRGYDNPH